MAAGGRPNIHTLILDPKKALSQMLFRRMRAGAGRENSNLYLFYGALAGKVDPLPFAVTWADIESLIYLSMSEFVKARIGWLLESAVLAELHNRESSTFKLEVQAASAIVGVSLLAGSRVRD